MTQFASKWLKGDFEIKDGKSVILSVVAYGHALGIPARFCSGLIPAIELSRQLSGVGHKNVAIRLIDPTPIANYCNGWNCVRNQADFRSAAANFLAGQKVEFFFDEAMQICPQSLGLLQSLGRELENSDDAEVADMVVRIKESGKKHGGESGERNSTLYMAAHPFSWLDMYHPLIWANEYPEDKFTLINLMSKSEARFSVVRHFIQKRHPELCSANKPIDCYMTLCDTPCYIPLDGEPLLTDLAQNSYDWCRARYRELRNRSSNHKRASKDFEALMSFIGMPSAKDG